MALTTAQQFEIERLGRALDAERDPAKLREMAKMLLKCWFNQKAASAWVMRQQCGAPSRFKP